MASITLNNKHIHITKLVEFANGTPEDSSTYSYNFTSGVFSVTNVTQEALESAYSSYDEKVAANAEYLSQIKSAAKRQIIGSVIGARIVHVSVLPYQELTYTIKAAEAHEYKTAGYPTISAEPTPTEYPFIRAESEGMGQTFQETADIIIAKQLEWKLVGAKIEQYRLAGNAAVESSLSIDEIAEQLLIAVTAIDAISGTTAPDEPVI